MVFETLHVLYVSCDRHGNAADKAIEIAKLVKNKIIILDGVPLIAGLAS